MGTFLYEIVCEATTWYGHKLVWIPIGSIVCMDINWYGHPQELLVWTDCWYGHLQV